MATNLDSGLSFVKTTEEHGTSGMTRKRENIYMYPEYKNKIVSFYKKKKRMPGYQEIMQLVGFRSKNAVYKLINRLVEDGVVKKDKNGKLSPSFPVGEISVLGVVEAGIPTAAEEQVIDTISLEDFLVDDAEETFMLEVKGESMIEAHIAEGDLVLVQRTQRAREGDIVIAEVDGEWTMKYYRKKGNKDYLQPANKKFKPIYPEESLRIAAVVKAVIRKFK